MVTLSGHDTLTNGSYIDAYYRPTMMPQSKPWPGTVRLSLEWFAFFGCQCDYYYIYIPWNVPRRKLSPIGQAQIQNKIWQ